MLVDDILTAIKLKGGFPTDNYFTDAELLILLNDEQRTKALPLLMKLHEDFLVQNKDYTIAANTTYRLPARIVGNKIRDLKLYTNSAYTDLNRLFEEDRSTKRTGYYLMGNKIELSEDITTGTLRLNYFLTPSSLVLSTSCAVIASIDSTTQITVSSLPSAITTGSSVDFMQDSAPNDLLAYDQTVSNVSGTTLTFASLPDDLAVGDYVCVAGQTCIPGMPEEFVSLLMQATLVSCLSSKKDKSVEFEKKKLEEMTEALLDLLTPRSESNDIRIRGQGMLTYIHRRR
jgi:hypothetical protein